MVNLASEDGENEPAANDTTSVLPSSWLMCKCYLRSLHWSSRSRLTGYRDFPNSQDEQVDDEPIIFWVVKEGKFPLLSRLVLDLLAIPAASAAPGRVFSIAAVASMMNANRLSERNLEKKVLFFSQYRVPTWFRSVNAKCCIRCLAILVCRKPVSFELLHSSLNFRRISD